MRIDENKNKNKAFSSTRDDDTFKGGCKACNFKK